MFTQLIVFLAVSFICTEAGPITAKCSDCHCSDCKMDRDIECFQPRKYKKSTKNKKVRNEINPMTSILLHACVLVSFDVNNNGVWQRNITRGHGNMKVHYEQCLEKRNNINFRNVICVLCHEDRCNDVAVREPTMCYSCSCENCDPTKQADINCIYPGVATDLIPTEKHETCVLTTWVTKNWYITISRTSAPDIHQCTYRSQQLTSEFTDVICSNCTSKKCNSEIVPVIPNYSLNNPLRCYVCRCEVCTMPRHKYCITPGNDTKLSDPLRISESCGLFVFKRQDGTVGIERKKVCDSEYCASRYLRLDNFTLTQCTQCLTHKCNGADKIDVFCVEKESSTKGYSVVVDVPLSQQVTTNVNLITLKRGLS